MSKGFLIWGLNMFMNKIPRVPRLIFGAMIFVTGIILGLLPEINSTLLFSIYLAAYIILGADIVYYALRGIIRGNFFDENFLMSLATIGAFIIGEYPEAAAVMLFFQVGEFFQEMAVGKSRKSITALMDIRPDFANLLTDGNSGGIPERVSPETVNIGELILVRPGEKIPLDGIVMEGESMLDTKALTGESLPAKARPNDGVLSGCINLNGVLTIKVTKTAGESTVAKIIDLVENAHNKKAPTENFITSFSRYYTPIVVSLAALIAFIPPLFGFGEFAEWVHRGLVFLVISCPCALVISIPLGFFGGIGGASRKGILIKGGNFLEALNKLDTIVFDKTGTLTRGVFEVTDIKTTEGCSREEVLKYAAKAEIFSGHPIAVSIKEAFGKEIGSIDNIDRSVLSRYNEISGMGISVMDNDKIILAGNSSLMKDKGIEFSEIPGIGTKVYIARDGRFMGSLLISDEIKKDSKDALIALKKRGIKKTHMLTGDNYEIAKAVAAELDIDEFHSELLPHQKVEKLEMLMNQKKEGSLLAFVGDGINDAPVLARSDIGIAMGALGSDAAIEAADIVLMNDNLLSLIEGIKVAAFTKRVVWQNIIFALGIKAAFLALGAIGIASMWEAVFADVGVAVLAILNASRVIRS